MNHRLALRPVVAMLFAALLLSPLVAGPASAAAPGGKGAKSSVACPVAGGAEVVLDPGHGGSDTGAVNTDYNLSEKDLTLDIAARAQTMLERAGYRVALTRTTDEALGNSERGEIANACGAKVFVEIHLNGSSDSSVDYSQTFWGKKNKDLAFSQAMSGALASLGIANHGAGQFANGGLLQATMPSTLVEAVFLTNDAEAARLAAGTRQDEIASAIASGVEGWL